MPRPERRSLWALTLAVAPGERWVSDDRHHMGLDALASGSCLTAPAETLRGRSVLVLTQSQLPTVLVAVELDGIARRILLCPPDVAPGVSARYH